MTTVRKTNVCSLISYFIVIAIEAAWLRDPGSDCAGLVTIQL